MIELRVLDVKLSRTDLEIRARQMAGARAESERLKEEKKNSAARLKVFIDEQEALIDKCARAIDTGIEPQKVECEWVVDAAAGKKRLIRRDTSEVVTEDRLTTAERQPTLPGVPAEGNDGDGPYDEAEGAPTGAPRTTLLVLLEDWGKVPPAGQKRVTDLVERYDFSMGPDGAVMKTSPLTVGGRGLAGLKVVLDELSCPYQHGDVVDAAPEGEPIEASDEPFEALKMRIAEAPDQATLADIWVDVEAAKQKPELTEQQYGELDALHSTRMGMVPEKAEPKRVKPARKAKAEKSAE